MAIALLHAIEAGPVCDALANELTTHLRSRRARRNCTSRFRKPASRRSTATCTQTAKPATTSTYSDRLNYATFATAANDLNGWPIPNLVSGSWVAYMGSFDAWQALNPDHELTA